MTLGQTFDPRNNALNAWRIVLAASVILAHSWPLTGHKLPYPMGPLLAQVGVDGFFALSGFLITSSWMRNPRPREYFSARALRIFPGLWVCLMVTAFVIAPLSVTIQGGSATSLLTSLKPIEYVLNNGLLNVYYVGIDGTPKDIPWPGVWNGSIWTLVFEVICYLAVAALGAMGLLKRSWTIPSAFVLFLCATAYFSYPAFALETIPQMVARFAVMFAAGALLFQFRDVIPARWSLITICLGALVLSGLLSNYRVIGALPLAYIVIASGALIHDKRLNLRNDLSYGVYIYAFPIQQFLAVLGFADLNPFLFFAIATTATLPMAALSWFVVEKHAMSLKSRLTRTVRPGAGGPADQPV
ncbi:acyltransferase [Mycobacterium sp. CBMA271]|uniref:acyltransferase family protein n=1 Tax=unclassified Mycobacteroides TaxID=2618759 RepID=UPI0012DDA8A6|nr:MULTISPECIES: acyltransferase [unclassified Mycobacteroides]MUM17857.1 acyltransferase [Mycobacteroides sp. CBMA 326]MUM20428.1 acyltransferase [Mycobacteroides sp. CBMA 271]